MLYGLSQVCNSVKGEKLLDTDSLIRNVCIDSRKVLDGTLFFAIKGERVDGHDYVLNAAKNNASAAVISKELDPFTMTELKKLNFGLIKVDDTQKTLSEFAKWHRSNCDIKLVGVTGSAGKTTTKDIITSVLRKKFDVISTKGNLNNELGVPLTLLSIENDHEMAVVEMAMRGFGQIKELCEYAKPLFGVITNIGDSHIEFLKSRENIAKAKWEIVESLPENGCAILNGDDGHLLRMLSSTDRQTVCYGIQNEENDVRAVNITSKPDGTYFKICISDKLNKLCNLSSDVEEYELFIPIPGKHNVLNALAAVSVGLLNGIDIRLIAEGLCDLVRSPMRMSFLQGKNGYTIIDDSYNANPPAMKCALEAMCDFSGEKRKVAILGGMVDLGEYVDEGHRKVAEYVISSNVNILITTGALGAKISKEALRLGMNPDNVFICKDNNEAVLTASNVLLPQDVVLVKGSRLIKTDEIVKELTL